MTDLAYNIKEGMDVYGANGEKVGEVGEVVVGGTSREARLFTIQKGLLFTKDYLVPREAITRVDDKGAHVELTKDQVERLPEYQGRAPDSREVEQAYEKLGGRRTTEGFTFDSVPYGTTGPEERSGISGGTPYIVTVEEYLILTPEERERQGYRESWDYGETGRGSRSRDRV